MQKIDWGNVQEAQDYENPMPGGYIAKVCRVEDNERKEYLRVEWDFADGNYIGANEDTYGRVGFWPITLFRSYKPKALPFFKAFKTALEESNRRYQFREDNLGEMEGKMFGVVLGEEEYEKKDGSIGKRLYVSATRSIKAIQDGDFKVPEFKKLKSEKKDSNHNFDSSTKFTDLDDDGELPF